MAGLEIPELYRWAFNWKNQCWLHLVTTIKSQVCVGELPWKITCLPAKIPYEITMFVGFFGNVLQSWLQGIDLSNASERVKEVCYKAMENQHGQTPEIIELNRPWLPKQTVKKNRGVLDKTLPIWSYSP